MSARKALSKRTRFAVFARDNFTCRYCGRQSDEVVLVIDHLHPVAQGGTDAQENLVTACEECNQGKADKTILQHVPSDFDRLRMEQERREQEYAAENARATAAARQAFDQNIVNYWCDVRKATEANSHTIRLMASFARQHGCEIVFEWIDIAHARLPFAQDYKLAKYICGIRRRMMNEGALPTVGE